MGLFQSSDGIRFNPLWHSFSLLLTLISFILLMVVVFYNAPIDHVHSTLDGKVGLRMWLLTTDETSVSFPTWTIGTKRYYDAAEGEMPGKGIGLAAPASNEERGTNIGAVSEEDFALMGLESGDGVNGQALDRWVTRFVRGRQLINCQTTRIAAGIPSMSWNYLSE